MKNYLIVNLPDGTQIVFDEYQDNREIDDEMQTFWVTMCADCIRKYRFRLSAIGCTIDDFGSGCCSVLHCDKTGENEDTDVFYVDIPVDVAMEVDEI